MFARACRFHRAGVEAYAHRAFNFERWIACFPFRYCIPFLTFAGINGDSNSNHRMRSLALSPKVMPDILRISCAIRRIPLSNPQPNLVTPAGLLRQNITIGLLYPYLAHLSFQQYTCSLPQGRLSGSRNVANRFDARQYSPIQRSRHGSLRIGHQRRVIHVSESIEYLPSIQLHLLLLKAQTSHYFRPAQLRVETIVYYTRLKVTSEKTLAGVPTVEDLVQAHVDYMGRLSETDREQSALLTASLNIPALLEVATHTLGSECYRMDKLYEGGFNQVYNLAFRDENINAIVRINMPYGGGVDVIPPLEERQDRVQSEAATLKWLRENTSIPVPRVFAYDGNPDSNVGAAYIIEERIIGQPLHDVWENLDLESRNKIIQQLAPMQAQLLKASFPLIGSLYEDISAPTASRFYVGRSAPPVQVERHKINRGPWRTPREYLHSVITEQIQEITFDEERVWAARKHNKADESGCNIEDFKALYSAILHLVDNVQLLDECDHTFCLSHPDFTTRNMLVAYDDPTSVVAILDWEGARIQPWWFTSPTPAFMWDEQEKSPRDSEDDDTEGLTWQDIFQEWNNAMVALDLSPDPENGYFFGRLDCLACAGYASWATSMDFPIDFVMEWRLSWPRLHDSAFELLDAVLRKHRPDFSLDETQGGGDVDNGVTAEQRELE
ncbi:Altered inheritance of mitochondria protein 9, mitochondrial [Hypsizygus marmoreus]|uniref:Altered inheritance of mitochondria protein 9, mitochondrial n=1 Tax=Hypsizygus marmoreus TaxID=39966 RepID=A0A369JYT7_HYPMA|nr:Altered inheritance of mitochondria protein 9, mitochondrial [Hypsizygus marmoreus]